MVNKGKGCISAIFNGSIPIGIIKHGLDTIFQKPSEPVVPPIEPSPIEGYTVLDSIYGDGNQYAIIDYYANQNTKVEMKFMYAKNASTPSCLYTGRTAYSNNAFGFMPCEGEKNVTRSSYGKENKEFGVTSANTVHTVIQDGIYTYIDGELKVTHTTATFKAGNPMYVLMQPSSTATPLEAKIYYMKIWDNGELVHDLIPALNDETGIAGLYDLITKEFITSATTTEFYPSYKIDEINYVENGLTALFVGLDDYVDGSWMDRVSGYKFTPISSSTKPVYSAITKLYNQNTFGGMVSDFTIPAGSDFSFEVVTRDVKDATSSDMGSNYATIVGGAMSNWSIAGGGIILLRNKTSSNTLGFISPENGVTAYSPSRDDIIDNGLDTFTYVPNVGIFHNGIKVSEANANTTERKVGLFTHYSGSYTSYYRAKAKIHSVRVYNRQLTAEEVAQNHAEDIRIYGE